MTPWWAVILAALIAAGASVWVGVYSRSTRHAVRRVEKNTATRNGDTLGELMEDLFTRLRKMEKSVKTLETAQDEIMEGVGYVALQVGRLQRHQRWEPRQRPLTPEEDSR